MFILPDVGYGGILTDFAQSIENVCFDLPNVSCAFCLSVISVFWSLSGKITTGIFYFCRNGIFSTVQ